jgi:2-dehydropantoate 2-reductase
MNNQTKIAVIGLGGVGGYFGFKLAQAYAASPAAEISFVARGETYAAVATKGLILDSPEHQDRICFPTHLAENVSQLSNPDVYLLCVKEYDLEKLCNDLKNQVTDQTILLPLMNGVDVYERIRKVLTKGIVLPACVYVASHIRHKGEVEHKGKPGKILMGKDPQYPEFMPATLLNLMKNAKIDIEYREKVFADIWTKYLFIASFGLVSARYNQPIGQILEEPGLRALAIAVMEEVLALAEKKGIALPQDSTDQTFLKAGTFPYHTPTSLQLDIQAKKDHNELDLFAGTIIRYGRAFDIPVPATDILYREITGNLAASALTE